jgi:hypothetical protein
VPSCQAECTYPSATESMVERADSNWKWNLWMGKCESSKRSCHNRPVPISEQTQWGHIVFSFSPPSATLQKVEQSVLRFLRMRMRLKTIFSWVSEDEDEVENNLSLSSEDDLENNLCLGFWGWWWAWGVLSNLWFMISRCILYVCTDCQLSTICIRNCCLKGRSHVTEGAVVYLALLSFEYLVVQYRVSRDEPCLLSLSQAHNSDSSHCLQKIWLPQIWLELRNADFV